MTENYESVDLEILIKQFNEIKIAAEADDNKIFEIKEEMQSLRAKLDELSKEARALTVDRQSKHSTMRVTQNEIEKVERLQQIQKEQELLATEYNKKSAEFDELTKDAIWRKGTEHGWTAKNYQIEGSKVLATARRGILGDKRGLGKTLTGIIWLDMVQARKVVIFAPNDVCPQFEEEIREWAPHRVIMPLRGMSPDVRKFAFQQLRLLDSFIIVLNYEAWRRDSTIIDELTMLGIDSVILDEAHRAKSSEKITARGIFQVVYRPNLCATCEEVRNFKGPWKQKNAKGDLERIDWVVGHDIKCDVCQTLLESTVFNVLSMTGTPILNKPQEVFTMLYLVNKSTFPTERKFLDTYCYQQGPNQWRFLPGGLDRLVKFLGRCFIQRDRNDVGLELPPPAIFVHTLEKDKISYPRQYEAERQIAEASSMVLEDGTRKDIFFILELLLRERQCMVWPAGINITHPETKEVICNLDVYESQKLDVATDLMTDLMEEGERFVVFSQFKPPLYEAYNRMKAAGHRVVTATGDDPVSHRDLVKKDFDLKTASKDDYRWQAVFCTYKAFGTGINLNAANTVIMLDDEWNPGMEDQAIGRIDRMNSEVQATVHKFVVKDSIDEWMVKLMEQKRDIVSGFQAAIGVNDLLEYFQERM